MGAGALAIAADGLRDTLGYEYVDQQLPVVVAKRLFRVAPETVDADRGLRSASLGERLLTSLERATPELAEASAAAEPFDEELFRAVAKTRCTITPARRLR